MIDPTNFTNFNRSYHELEEMWLFSCAVAGKTAKTQARLLGELLDAMPGRTPFAKIHNAVRHGTLLQYLKESGLGQYNRLARCYEESLALDLANDPVEKFETIFGVGSKTARMFLMHSRPNQRYAALDTHILKHLRVNGYDAPLTTPPPGTKYLELEAAFLALADKARMTPEDYDLSIWRHYAEEKLLKSKADTLWIFSHYLEGIPVFDRSLPAHSEKEAQDRVRELRDRGQDAFYCSTLPKHYWY